MNFYVTARGDPTPLRPDDIIGIRIRDMDGTVKPAFRVSSIQNVFAFRCLIVPLPGFATDRVPANGNPVFPQYLTIFHQQQEPLIFDYDNLVSMNDAGRGLTRQSTEKNNQNTENFLHHFRSPFNRFVTATTGYLLPVPISTLFLIPVQAIKCLATTPLCIRGNMAPEQPSPSTCRNIDTYLTVFCI